MVQHAPTMSIDLSVTAGLVLMERILRLGDLHMMKLLRAQINTFCLSENTVQITEYRILKTTKIKNSIRMTQDGMQNTNIEKQ